MTVGTAQGPVKAAQTLTNTYRLIESDLEEVERLIRDALSDEHTFVNEVVHYGFQLGGKRLRPALLLLSGRVFGNLTPDHYRTAAVLEIIHTATLIHDDILDGAKFRRHLETMNLRWNSGVSVLAGDLLFARALKLATVSDDLFGYRSVTEAMRRTCEAELRQVGTKGRFDLSREEYGDIISGKTAALLACSCQLGAHFSGADEDTKTLFTRFGEHLGQAFQIVDDILDLIGEEQIVGKTLGTDLLEGKATLPLIHHLESVSEKDRAALCSILNREEKSRTELLEIVALLRKSGAVDAARAIAVEKVETAVRELRQAAEGFTNPDSHVFLEGLCEIARFVIARKK